MNATVNEGDAYLEVNGEKHLPLRKARRRLGISRETAYRWRNRGWLTFVKHEGRIYIPERELNRPTSEGSDR